MFIKQTKFTASPMSSFKTFITLSYEVLELLHDSSNIYIYLNIWTLQNIISISLDKMKYDIKCSSHTRMDPPPIYRLSDNFKNSST